MDAPNDSSNPSPELNRPAQAFVGIIAGMLLAIIFGIGLDNPEYDSQEYWKRFERDCAPEVCDSPLFEEHRATLHRLALDVDAVDDDSKGRMLAALRCAHELSWREHLIASGRFDAADPVALKLTREHSESCRTADSR